MKQTVLVIGGGPTGLSAAHGLASVGCDVVLVEKEDRLGGAPILSGYARLVPSGEWAKDAIGRMVARVEGHPSVRVLKSRKVRALDGAFGRFRATLSDGSELSCGAVLVCTGFTHFDPINKPEWGFGTFEDVVTTTQVEQMVAAGKVYCPSDGRIPERVAILLCVGSRDRQIGREWCSKICCTVSTNLAMEIRELYPKTDVFIYYMDIRTFGLYEDRYYWRSQEEFRTKFVKARIAEVTRGADGRLLLKGEDTLVKRPIVIPMDLVVHAIGMDPNSDNLEIVRSLGIKLERHGFIERGEHYTASFSSTRHGVYVGGSALAPEDIDTCVAHGLAMAMRAVGELNGTYGNAA